MPGPRCLSDRTYGAARPTTTAASARPDADTASARDRGKGPRDTPDRAPGRTGNPFPPFSGEKGEGRADAPNFRIGKPPGAGFRAFSAPFPCLGRARSKGSRGRGPESRTARGRRTAACVRPGGGSRGEGPGRVLEGGRTARSHAPGQRRLAPSGAVASAAPAGARVVSPGHEWRVPLLPPRGRQRNPGFFRHFPAFYFPGSPAGTASLPFSEPLPFNEPGRRKRKGDRLRHRRRHRGRRRVRARPRRGPRLLRKVRGGRLRRQDDLVGQGLGHTAVARVARHDPGHRRWRGAPMTSRPTGDPPSS
jgi:hypothetical protein